MYDVIVIGGGPAGSIAALQLARAGRGVLLVDRSAFPRPKVCGDCLNPRIRPLLAQLGLLEEFEKLSHHIIQGVVMERDGVPIFHQPIDHELFRSTSRYQLDAWLLAKAELAGAEILAKTAVTNVDAESGIVSTDQARFTAKLILAADGRNSLTAKSAGLASAYSKCRRIGWQTTLSLPDLDNNVHMNVFEGGYYGLVKINPTEANLCLVLDARSPLKPADVILRFFPSVRTAEWRSIHPINRPNAQPAKNRVWLLGDAAHVVEPFTGEGIFFAMASAFAATNLINGLGNTLGSEDHSRTFAAAHHSLYRGELSINQITRWALEKSSRGYRLLDWLKAFPTLLRLATDRVVAQPA